MVLGFQEDMIVLMKCLVKNYTLFLLSNTNEIHVPVYTGQFKKSSGGITFDDVFSKIYYSHDLKLSKPDPAIYRFVLEDSEIDPETSLFIDDLEQNVVASIEVLQFDSSVVIHEILAVVFVFSMFMFLISIFFVSISGI